jgi:hypothetical protein
MRDDPIGRRLIYVVANPLVSSSCLELAKQCEHIGSWRGYAPRPQPGQQR